MSDAAAPSAKAVEVEVFPNAPVTEAILGIEVAFLDDLTIYVERFHSAIKELFPEREAIDAPDAGDIQWLGERSNYRTSRKGEPAGFRLLSADKRQVVQITRRGLTYHRLRPYGDWGHFTEVAVPVWSAFAAIFAPEYIASLRLRYLNRIEVPLPVGDLSDYLTMLPQVPQPVDTGFTAYLMRITLWDPHLKAHADVTQIAQPADDVPLLPVIFDIDVRSNVEITSDERVLWRSVEALREYKNRIFFSSITAATRALFR